MAEKKLSVKLSLNDKQFQTGLRKATRSMKKFGDSMQRTGQTLSRNLTLPILAAGVASVKMASDFEESLNKTRVAFGNSSATVEEFAKTTLKSFGLAEGSALEMASLFGDLATSTGLGKKEAAEMSTTLVGLAGDLASFKNKDILEVQNALRGIFTGQTEAMTNLGVSLTESSLKQFGYNKTMSETEKIAIRYKAVLAKTINAQGDYLRTSDGVANSTRTLQESVKELSTELGVILIPITKKLIANLQELTDKFSSMSTEQKESIVKWAGITAVVGPLLILVGKMVTAVGSLGKALMWLNANPLVLLVSSVVGLTAALGFAILDLEGFTRSAMKLGRVGKMVASGLLAVLGPNSAEMQAARALLSMDFESFDASGPEGTFEKIGAYSGGTSGGGSSGGGGRAKARVPQSVSPLAAGPIEVIDPSQVPMMEALNSNFMSLRENMDEIWANLEIGESIFASFGSTLQQTFIGAMQSQEGFFKSFAEGAKQAVKALIAQIAAMSILTFLLGGTNLGASMGAGSMGGMAGVKGLFGLADGGLATGPSLAMVGEGPGTSLSNPEVIAPLDQLKNYMGGGAVEVFGTLSGSDILLSSNRARNNRNRTSGY